MARSLFNTYLKIVGMTVISIIISYAARVAFAKSTDAETYGSFYALLYFAGILAGFFMSAISSSIINKLASARTDEERARKATAGIVMALLSSALSISLYFIPAVREHIPEPSWTIPIIISMIYMSSLFIAMLNGSGDVVGGKMIDSARPLPLLISVAFFRDISSIVVSYVAMNALLSLLIFLLRGGSRLLKLSVPFAEDFAEMVRFGIPVFVVASALSLFNQLDAVFLTVFRSVREVGLYEIADPIANIIKYSIIPFTIMLFPLISRMFSRNQDISGISTLFLRLSIMIVVPIALVVVSFPDIIINLVFGADYLEVAAAVRILGVSAVFWSLFSLSSVVVSGMGRPEIATKASLIFGIANAAVDLFVVPAFGYVGASFTTMVAGALSFYYLFSYLKRNGVYSLAMSDLVRLFVPGAVTYVWVVITKHMIRAGVVLEAGIVASTSLLIYAYLMKRARIMKRQEADAISGHFPVLRPAVRWLCGDC